MKQRWRLAYTTASLALSGAVAADELTGSQSFICSAWHAAVCNTDGTCNNTEAWRLNMPDFLKVDLRGKTLVTPEGSDEPRATPIDTIAREGTKIFLSGHQGERSWSWILNESSGEGTLALVSDNSSVTVFTVCTKADES